MVVVWNELAEGNREYAAGLIALNSIFQVLLYSLYAYVFITVFTAIFGLKSFSSKHYYFRNSQKRGHLFRDSFVAGIISRYTLIKIKGEGWFKRNMFLLFHPSPLFLTVYHSDYVQP